MAVALPTELLWALKATLVQEAVQGVPLTASERNRTANLITIRHDYQTLRLESWLTFIRIPVLWIYMRGAQACS